VVHHQLKGTVAVAQQYSHPARLVQAVAEIEGRTLSHNRVDLQGGNLYGTAELGGATGDGVVFRLAPNSDGSWKEKVLHNFTGVDGLAPDGSLIFDHGGNLYGTASEGGVGRAGVVYKLTPKSKGEWHETVLHAFYDRPGYFPDAGVIFDAEGSLYGTTYGNSSTTLGSVFKITASAR